MFKKAWSIIIILLVAALLSAFVSKPVLPEELALFRGGPKHNGFYETGGPETSPQV